MARPSAALGLVAALLVASCAKSPAPGHEAAAPDSTPAPHGGVAIALGPSYRAELVVDATGMMVVRLYDSDWRILDPEGNSAEVTIATPDGASRVVTLVPMGTGTAAHYMGPMDEAVVVHVQDQGSYTATVHAKVFGRPLEGKATVRGLATGGQGM